MILDRLRGKKKREKGLEIPRSEFLKMIPVRNPQLRWEKNKKGNIRIFVPLKKPKASEEKVEKRSKKRRKKRKGLLSRIASTPKEKQVRLDAIGSIVWELCDGETTMEGIIEKIHEEHKMLPSEAEVALNVYFDRLIKRELVGLIVAGKTRARFEEAVQKQKEKKSRK